MATIILEAVKGRITADIKGEAVSFKSGGAESSTGYWPTEYIIASLGSCLAGTAFEYARTKKYPLEKVTARISWETASSPARIRQIAMVVTIEGDVTHEEKERILLASERACLVMNTLRLGVEEIETTLS